MLQRKHSASFALSFATIFLNYSLDNVILSSRERRKLGYVPTRISGHIHSYTTRDWSRVVRHLIGISSTCDTDTGKHNQSSD